MLKITNLLFTVSAQLHKNLNLKTLTYQSRAIQNPYTRGRNPYISETRF
jgi:hypothetical protein